MCISHKFFLYSFVQKFKKMKQNRRAFLKTAATATTAVTAYPNFAFSSANPISVEVVNPQNRVPVSLIIDDSTTLVNMAHLGFRSLPRFFLKTTNRTGENFPAKFLTVLCANLASGAPKTG
jgi:hypothetical protein